MYFRVFKVIRPSDTFRPSKLSKWRGLRVSAVHVRDHLAHCVAQERRECARRVEDASAGAGYFLPPLGQDALLLQPSAAPRAGFGPLESTGNALTYKKVYLKENMQKIITKKYTVYNCHPTTACSYLKRLNCYLY